MASLSCVGFAGPVAFRPRGCSLALAGMQAAGMGAPPGGALTVVGSGTARGGGIVVVACKAPARLVPSGAVATPGNRKAILACQATGLQGGDYSPFDTDKLSLPELLDLLARKTLFVLDRVHLPKLESYVPDDQRPSVSHEIEAIQARCQELVDELDEGRISFHPAAIKLLGIHDRMVVLFTFCRLEMMEWRKYMVAAPESLQQYTSAALLTSVSNTVDFYNKLQKQPDEHVCGPTKAGEAGLALSELLLILMEKTSLLLDKMPHILLPWDDTLNVTLREVMSSSLELEELKEICHQLNKEVAAQDHIPDHVAAGTLLGLHRRLGGILSEVNEFFYGGGGNVNRLIQLPAILQALYRSTLVFTMSEVELWVMEYSKKKTAE